MQAARVRRTACRASNTAAFRYLEASGEAASAARGANPLAWGCGMDGGFGTTMDGGENGRAPRRFRNDRADDRVCL